MNASTFTPGYTWRTATIPFRLFLDHSKCRVFIIDNILHNYDWMVEYHASFRSTDFFFVHCTWFCSSHVASKTAEMFTLLGLNKLQFYFLFNSKLEQQNLETYGFQGDLINHNCWLDYNSVMKPLGLPKLYDAIYVARRTAFKRHMLASKVSNLALVAGHNHENVIAEIPPSLYLNTKTLLPDEVCTTINQACCGLLLSESEGACYSSSEYLLCGIPVVSTPSTGGRDVWYDEYNSIICEPAQEAVAAAVNELVRTPKDPLKIRARHIELSIEHREKFINALSQVFLHFGVADLDPRQFFAANYVHKMRRSCVPDFAALWTGNTTPQRASVANPS